MDQRLLEILSRKSGSFDAFARRSDTAHSAPEAPDVCEQSPARAIAAAEQRRLNAV